MQDLETLPELSELVEEAMGTEDHQDADALPDFFDTPEGQELVRALDAEEDDAWSEGVGMEAWRGDLHPDESLEDDWDHEWMSGHLRRPLVRFNLHVMIEHAGDIPADTSWLTL